MNDRAPGGGEPQAPARNGVTGHGIDDLTWLADVPGVERAILAGSAGDIGHVEVSLEDGYWARAEASHLRAVSGVFDAIADGRSETVAGGWISAITSEPFSAQRMDRWAADALKIMLERPPQRVLEIGCGEGALLTRLAPIAHRYVGVELSSTALSCLADSLAESPYRDRVELIAVPAHDLGDVEGSFDLVILNSVVQYFPSASYLARVLGLAASKLVPGGRLFVGDVRHPGHVADLALRSAVHRMGPNATGRQVLAEAQRRITEESELLLRPEFLVAWADDAGLTADVRLRESAADDLGYYRYDVIIETQTPDLDVVTPHMAWAEAVADLRRALTTVAQGDQTVRLLRVPNNAARATRAARESMISEPAGLVVQPEARAPADSVIPPELVDLCAELGLEWAPAWPGCDLDRDDQVDVLVAPAELPQQRCGRHRREQSAPAGGAKDYVSTPLESMLSAKLARRWREAAPDHVRMLRPVFTFQPSHPSHGDTALTGQPPTQFAVLTGPVLHVDPGQTLHGLVLQYGDQHPDDTAVVAGDRRITHRELRSAAEDVAGRLSAVGVRPGDVVGLYVDRGWELVVGMLGILVSGASYLGLDRDNPVARTQQLLQKAGAVCVVSTPRAVGGLANLVEDPILVDETFEARPGTRRLGDGVDGAASGAYLIFTSGSTGEPKGVVVDHGQAVNLVAGLDSVLGVPSDPGSKTWLAATNICFDISVAEIFWPLSRGVRLVIGDTGRYRGSFRGDDKDLVSLFEEHPITHFQSTPSLVRLLLQDPRWRTIVEDLDVLVVGGEVLTRSLAEELTGVGVLVNGYGPTEATVYTTMHVVDRGSAGPVPIGAPLANVTVRIVDESLATLAVGQTGEVLIGGAGVARGYLGPASNQGGFVLANIDGSSRRWYRTGDLGRIDAYGSLHYVGRRDGQVKIRGYRVELGEIEDMIRRNPEVRDCAVVARGSGNALTHLDAAIVLDVPGSSTLSGKALRDWVSERLPAYMVPTSVTTVPALPMTASGKLDRRAVLDLLPARADVAPPTAGPTDPTSIERTVCRIWSDVLGIDEIPLQQNFFDVGGNSLLLAQVHDRLSDILPDPLELLDLFRYPTVSGLVAHLSRGHGPDPQGTEQTGTDSTLSRRTRSLAVDRRRLRT